MKRTTLLLLRLVIGGVFIWAGVVKALDPAGFAEDIEAYQLVSYTLSVAVALYLPWLEIFCGMALISGYWIKGASINLTFLLLIFIGALMSAWLRGLDINCGCFSGTTETGDYLWPILRDVMLLFAISLIWILSEKKANMQKQTNAIS